MKRLGLIGGSGWPSTLEYYRLLNIYHAEIIGSSHSMDMIIRNLDFGIFSQILSTGDTEAAIAMLVRGINDCEKAGAEYFSFSANGLHRFLNDIKPLVKLPYVHIADATAKAVNNHKIKCVGLLGVRATMDADFYPERLNNFGIKTLFPSEKDKDIIDDIIFSELIKNKLFDHSKKEILRIMRSLKSDGSEGIILGCTELPLIIQQTDFDIPVFATTEIHCRELVNYSLEK